MIFSQNSEKKLKEQILQLLKNTSYQVASFKYDKKYFGNIVTEITNDNETVRFVYDRGDIYLSRKNLSSNKWLEENVLYTHSDIGDTQYTFFFKAIEEYLKKNDIY